MEQKASLQRLPKSQVLQDIRIAAENRFKYYLLTSFVRFSLTFPPNLPLPLVTFDHLQDLCNKPTAMYTRKTPRENCLNREKIKNHIFDKWARGNFHTTNIEFYNFFAKLIKLKDGEDSAPASTEKIVALHRALLERYAQTEPQFESYGSFEALKDGLVGHLIYNYEQRQFYKIKPLFQALIIIIEGETKSGCTAEETAKLEVSLVRTGVTTGLSGPISFSRFGKGDEVSCVTVSLEEAVRFVMDLDEREENLNPREHDLTVLDENINEYAEIARRCDRLTDEDLLGPSTGWITPVHTEKEVLERR
jgi:hypothetical protein